MTSLALGVSAEPSTRDRLLAEAIRAFTTTGFDGVSLREVERAAGVSRGLVAHHFGTKDALWRECVNWLMGRFHDELERFHEHLADVSHYERARVLLKVDVRFAARHPEYTRLLVLSGDDESERVRWMVDTWIRPNFGFYDRMSGTTTHEDDRYQAMAVYAFMGAASLLFTLPVEARMVFGVDTADEQFIEQFAEVMVDWVAHERPTGTARPVSALDRAVRSVRSRAAVDA